MNKKNEVTNHKQIYKIQLLQQKKKKTVSIGCRLLLKTFAANGELFFFKLMHHIKFTNKKNVVKVSKISVEIQNELRPNR